MFAGLILPASGQSVISIHSGTVHFFEGAVYLDNQPLEFHPGRFSAVPKGGELRTEEGRAEVLLTPDVFVRMGSRSTIRMLDNDLSHTRVELVAGSAVVDSEKPDSGMSVMLTCRKWRVRLLEEGVYRIDSEPPHLWVFEGKAEVSADNHADTVVGPSMDVPFAEVLVPQRSLDTPHDALTVWAEGRRESISADNAIAANIQDPGSMDLGAVGPDGFTYFPALGLRPIPLDLSSTYSYLGLNQPGFNSAYLPGYTFLPVSILLWTHGNPPNRLPSYPPPISVHPTPVVPVGVYPIPGRPTYPHPTPVNPVPVTARSSSNAATHVGVHR
jgi:hypothetical protein